MRKVRARSAACGDGGLPREPLCVRLGCAEAWGLFLALGDALCGRWLHAVVPGIVTVAATVASMRLVPRIKFG